MEPHRNGTLSIVKTKGSRIICEEVDEAVDDDVAWSCGRVIQVTSHDNVFSSLNFSFSTWAAGREVGVIFRKSDNYVIYFSYFIFFK